jgi:hypothetical protein
MFHTGIATACRNALMSGCTTPAKAERSGWNSVPIKRGCSSRYASLELFYLLCQNNARIQPNCMQPTKETGMLDFYTPVLYKS